NTGVLLKTDIRVARRAGADPQIEELNVGEAAEPQGRGTGATVTDIDGDGELDLLVAHGESASQPISVFKVTQGSSNHWLRVIPRTRFGSFARGARVTAYTNQSGALTRIIDGGSGYLCEMEPVAHFGLGNFLFTSHLRPNPKWTPRPYILCTCRDLRGFNRCSQYDNCSNFPSG
uniref:Cartilage acidic protein 1a n=1 Tax=Hucho hucho TaxID=62062 RepID=A0A4W5PTG7_9TELE